MPEFDAVVIGSGTNGLSAAITIARTGRKVIVLEAAPTIGGACQSAQITLPGFTHDVCSAVHPLAVASPFFRSLPLAAHGLRWAEPAVMVAHPLSAGKAVGVYKSIERTAAQLGADEPKYRNLFDWLVRSWPMLETHVLGPLRIPSHPVALARFGLHALLPAVALARWIFTGEAGQALMAGHAAHASIPLDRSPSAGIALVLNALAHTGGWCLPIGGAQSITNALCAHLQSLGGQIVTDSRVTSFDQLPTTRSILCDLSPAPLLQIAGDRFPHRFRHRLARYRYGMGVFKVDWALDAPVPWQTEVCAIAGTVHLGGTMQEIASSELETWRGHHTDRPFVLFAQPTIVDPSRAPEGKHIAWAYCHVPHGSTTDMLGAIERQIERFAPGFRERVIARAVTTSADIEARNPNLRGGDIAAGAMTLSQVFTRPTWRSYSTPLRGVYVCSAATPPGPGVHGICGFFAAQRALAEVLRD